MSINLKDLLNQVQVVKDIPEEAGVEVTVNGGTEDQRNAVLTFLSGVGNPDSVLAMLSDLVYYQTAKVCPECNVIHPPGMECPFTKPVA